MQRSELQRDADKIDLDLSRIEQKLHAMAERTPAAGPRIRGVMGKIYGVRTDVRAMMHADDRLATPY